MLTQWWNAFWPIASPIVSILGLATGIWGIKQRSKRNKAVIAARETIEGARSFLVGFKPCVMHAPALRLAIEDQQDAIAQRKATVDEL